LALSGQLRIPAATRELITRAAEELGYRRDPMLGALAAYRKGWRTPAQFRGELAWLCHTTRTYAWRRVPQFCEYFDAAAARAHELGYTLNEFDFADYPQGLGRLARVLAARNVRGAVLVSQPQADTALRLDLSGLAAVTFGYSLLSPRLHAVTSHHYGAMTEIVSRLRVLGHRRIGYAIPAPHDQRLDRLYSSAYLQAFRRSPRSDQVPMLEVDQPDLAAFRLWWKVARPTAIVTVHYGYPEIVAQAGLRVPEDVSVALVSITDQTRYYSGIDECSREVGRTAVDFAVELAERGSFGVPEFPRRQLLPGRWWAGESVRSPR
jgi:DNA-binding LacI/PurR family transcriptional regulator